MKLTNEQRKAIYRRDGFRCALCDGTQYLQVHHYIKRSDGGSNSPHNMITLCHCCQALAHGIPMLDMKVTAQDMEQYIVEYLADMYPGEWNPYRRE